MRYLRTFLLALQAEFTSRVNLIGWFLVGAIPSIVLVLVWFAILGDRPSINGFTKGDFLIYYTFVTVGWYIVGGTFGINTGNRVKDGTINTTLLKPYDVVLGQGIEEQAWKVMSIVMTFPITVLVLYLFRDIIHIQLAWGTVPILIAALILGGINFALVEAIVGITAFWVTDVWPVDHVKRILLSLFGGLLVPLTLMPPIVLNIANLLPFKYMFYIPVSILLSKSQNPLLDVGLQALYIFILFWIYKLIWNLGIRKYEAIGG
jgi:ABC-2 type transport system permease protein